MFSKYCKSWGQLRKNKGFTDILGCIYLAAVTMFCLYSFGIILLELSF